MKIIVSILLAFLFLTPLYSQSVFKSGQLDMVQYLHDAQIIDFDSDGDIDFLTTKYNGLQWLENDGSLNFISTAISSQHTGPKLICAGDIDNDGDVDFFCFFEDDNLISLMQNDGNQNFAEQVVNNSAYDINALFLSDLDMDGDSDLVVASSSTNRLYWLENDTASGNVIFTQHIIDNNNDYSDAFIIDMDGDADKDIVVSSYDNDKIIWFENDSSQNFSKHNIYTSADGASSVFAIDMDNDNDIDILSASYNDDKVILHVNDGSQNFNSQIISQDLGSGSFNVKAGDLDNDGDMDIVSGNYRKQTLRWWEQKSSGNYSSHYLTYATGTVGSSDMNMEIMLFDIEGDNDMDIIYVHTISDYITLFENSECDTLSAVTLPFVESWDASSLIAVSNEYIYCEPNYRWYFNSGEEGRGRAQWGSHANGNEGITLDAKTSGSKISNFLELQLDLSSYVSATELELSFSWEDHNDNNDTNDGVWLRAHDTLNWSSIYNIYPNSFSSETEVLIDLDSALSVIGQSPGSRFQLRFGQEGSSYEPYYDGITYRNIIISNCAKPKNLTVSNITNTEVFLEWDGPANASAYNIEYGLSGFIQGTGFVQNASAANYQLTGLIPETEYEVYIRSDCGNGDFSFLIGPYSFETLCDPKEVFKSCQIELAQAICFQYNNLNGDSKGWQNITYGVPKPYCRIEYSDIDNDDWLILPAFELTGNEELVFDVRTNSLSKPAFLNVKLSNSETDTADFTVDLYNSQNIINQDFETIVIDLSQYSSTSYIAFIIEGVPQSTNTVLSLDNICLKKKSCASLQALSLPFNLDLSKLSGTVNENGKIVCDSNLTLSFSGSHQSNSFVYFYSNYYNTASFFRLGHNPPFAHPSFNDSIVLSELILNFNLSAFTSSSNMKARFILYDTGLDFEHQNDVFWVRDSDQGTWIKVIDLLQYNEGEVLIDMDSVIQSNALQLSNNFQFKFSREEDYNHFYQNNPQSMGITIYDFNIWNCKNPDSIEVISTTHNAAEVVWGQGSNVTIEYGNKGFDVGQGNRLNNLSSNYANITNLTPNTKYDFYLRDSCGPYSNSNWVGPFQFYTYCDDTLVITELFETFDSGITTGCWSIIPSQIDTFTWRIENDFVQIKNLNSKDDWLISPPLFFSGNQFLCFDLSAAENSGIIVRMSTTGIDTNSFNVTVLDTLFSDNDHNGPICLDLGVQTDTIYLSFVNQHNGYVYSWTYNVIDNIYFENCVAPTNIKYELLSENSLNIIWEPSLNNTSCQLKYNYSGGPPSSSIIIDSIQTMSYTLSGLSLDTLYDFWIRSACSPSDTSAWAGPFSFHTGYICPCDEPEPLTLPFIEDWEIFSGTKTHSDSLYCDSTKTWSFQTSNLNIGRVRYGANSSYPYKGDGSLDLESLSSQESNNKVNLKLNLAQYQNEDDLYLSIAVANYGIEEDSISGIWIKSSNSNPWVKLYKPNINKEDQYDFIYNLDIDSCLSANNQFIDSIFQISLRYLGDDRVNYSGYGLTGGLSFDNIIVSDCSYPENIIAINKTTNSAQISWKLMDSSASVDLSYGLVGFNADSGTIVASAGGSHILNGLYSGETYSIYLRSICASGAVNTWVGPYSFTTKCSVLQPVDLPYFENWERNGSTSTGASLMYCDSIALWTYNSSPEEQGYAEWGINSGGWIEYSSDEDGAIVLRNGGGQGNLPSNKAVLELDMSNYVDSTDIYLSFVWENLYENDHPDDAVWIRENDSLEWIKAHQLYPFAWGAPFSFTEIEVNDIDLDSFLSINGQKFGPNFQIAFGQQSGYYTFQGLLFDDIHIFSGSCPKPDSLKAIFIDTSNAELSWACNTGNYNIKYGLTGTHFDSLNLVQSIDSNNHIVSGLNPNLEYEFYVQSYCSATSYSKWVGPLQFGASCSTLNVPFIENFGSSSNTEGCWSVVDNNFDNYQWENSSTAKVLYIRDHNDDWLISPPVNLSNQEALTFDYLFTDNARNCHFLNLEILISTTTNSTSSFTDTLLASQAYWTNGDIPNIIDLSDYSGKVFIAFHIKDSSSVPAGDGVYFRIEKFSIEKSIDPEPILSDLGDTSATITWWKNNILQSVDIEYGPNGFSLGSGTQVNGYNANSFHLSGLSAETEYDFYIRNNCIGDTTNWERLDFKTTIELINATPWCEEFGTNSTSNDSWQYFNLDNSQRTWELYTGSAGGTSRFQKIASDVECADDWLVSPKVTLNGNNYLKFTYVCEYYSSFYSYPFPIEVWLSDKGSHPDSFNYNVLPLTILYENYGSEMIIDLSGYSGEYNIAWRFRGWESNDIYDTFLGIDNICIKSNCETLLPLSLPFYEDWDTVSGVGNGVDTIYCDEFKKWYHMGKMYYGANALNINNGTGAFSILNGYGPPQSVLTLNMAPYINDNDLELSFAWSRTYTAYDDPSTGVFIRGSINDPWVKAHHINVESSSSGVYKMVENIDLDSVLSANAQSFSESLQIGFSQYSGNYYLHFDDISIYKCPISSYSINQTVCDSFTLNNSTYYASGQYLQKLQNHEGCDSLISLDLVVGHSSFGVLDTAVCGSFSVNGQTYTQTGTYTQTINNLAGCDSILSINLTILNNSTTSIVASSCSTYTLNGQIYSQSGIYNQTLTNSIGCDSVLTLDLTITTIPDLTISGLDSVNNGQTTTYTIANNTGSSYAWAVTGGSIVSGSGTYSITVEWTSTGTGVIKVVETDINGCVGDESSFDVNIDWGLNIDEFNGEGIDIYPNPFSEFTSINFSNESNDKFSLLIYDLSGKTLSNTSNIQGSVYRLNKGNLNAGIYLIELRSLNKTFKAKVLID